MTNSYGLQKVPVGAVETGDRVFQSHDGIEVLMRVKGKTLGWKGQETYYELSGTVAARRAGESTWINVGSQRWKYPDYDLIDKVVPYFRRNAA
ncbi:hypothetical protein [Nocardia asteroides]|uniref:hypothetical protein n=1 Tax=Nocardia asteroides TaxID=1824 RepID=UPI001E47FBA7|nr:hypothetical protein [Nocardia asteroides]UGT63939.1 hypothetical protein LTT61_11805 [Nocardia asteroides]